MEFFSSPLMILAALQKIEGGSNITPSVSRSVNLLSSAITSHLVENGLFCDFQQYLSVIFATIYQFDKLQQTHQVSTSGEPLASGVMHLVAVLLSPQRSVPVVNKQAAVAFVNQFLALPQVKNLLLWQLNAAVHFIFPFTCVGVSTKLTYGAKLALRKFLSD